MNLSRICHLVDGQEKSVKLKGSGMFIGCACWCYALDMHKLKSFTVTSSKCFTLGRVLRPATVYIQQLLTTQCFYSRMSEDFIYS